MNFFAVDDVEAFVKALCVSSSLQELNLETNQLGATVAHKRILILSLHFSILHYYYSFSNFYVSYVFLRMSVYLNERLLDVFYP